jgi:hypothetical protein
LHNVVLVRVLVRVIENLKHLTARFSFSFFSSLLTENNTCQEWVGREARKYHTACIFRQSIGSVLDTAVAEWGTRHKKLARFGCRVSMNSPMTLSLPLGQSVLLASSA